MNVHVISRSSSIVYTSCLLANSLFDFFRWSSAHVDMSAMADGSRVVVTAFSGNYSSVTLHHNDHKSLLLFPTNCHPYMVLTVFA